MGKCWYIGKMVGGNSALLLLIEENQLNITDKDLSPLLEQHAKVDFIINLSFLKCLKKAKKTPKKVPKKESKKVSKENYGLCIESSTIDLSFYKKVDVEWLKNCCPEFDEDKCSKLLNEGPNKCSEVLEKCCPTLSKKECSEVLEKCGKALVDKLNEYIDFIERL